VHCETLAKLLNDKAAFLGDSDFPKSALPYYKGGRIRLFQNLYEMYSRLDFTRQTDRPMAIAGLEKRLVRTFETRGGYGVFEAYLARALLWRRPDSTTLTRVRYPQDRRVPSWSWMAYSGGINYIEIPFEGAVWTADARSPFGAADDGEKRHWASDEDARDTDLLATAKRLRMDPVELSARVKLDEASAVDPSTLRCVVVGREKDDDESRALHWALIIRPISPPRGYELYERAGVGYLFPSHISDEPAQHVRIR